MNLAIEVSISTDGRQYCQKFPNLVEEDFSTLRLQMRGFGNQFQPETRFGRLFPCNPNLVHEVLAGLGTVGLAIVSPNGSAASNQLPSYGITGSSFWKTFHQSNNFQGKSHASLFQIIFGHHNPPGF